MRAIVFDPDAPNELLIDVKAISLNFGEVKYGDNAEHPGEVPGWDSAGVVVVIAVGAASGRPTLIDFESARMARKNNGIESFMVTWPVGEELQYVLDLAGRGQLDAQVGHRDTWDNLDAAIDALLGRRVAGKVALTVS